jgi:hypothetical protein
MRAKSRVPWIRRLDVIGRRRETVLDAPFDGPLEDRLVIVVHAEDETAIDHDAEAVQALRDRGIVATDVLALVALDEITCRQRLEPDKQATQTSVGSALGDVAAENRVNGGRALKQPAHAAHALEQRGREAVVAEQMVVEEIEMTARQPLDLGQRVVDALGVERTAPGEKGVLVAEVAVLRTPTSDDD